MKERIRLQELVAYNNTPKAQALISRYGYERARNYRELVDTLWQFTHDYRKEALAELAKIHPHRDLIIASLPAEKKWSGDGECPTCGGSTKSHSNFEMSEQYLDFIGKQTENGLSKDTFKEYLPIIAVAGIFALAITSLAKS